MMYFSQPYVFADGGNTMKSYILALLAVSLLMGISSAYSQEMVMNRHIAAIVDPSRGRISFFTSPGPPGGAKLSFPNFSFISFRIGGLIYTNDEYVSGSQVRLLENGVNAKVGDTITTTWTIDTNLTLFQVVYPVDLGDYGEIVTRFWASTKSQAVSVETR
jgi:hypothetical protein